jgi:hypothetical protein
MHLPDITLGAYIGSRTLCAGFDNHVTKSFPYKLKYQPENMKSPRDIRKPSAFAQRLLNCAFSQLSTVNVAINQFRNVAFKQPVSL